VANALEAKLRIAADFAEAFAALKRLKTEALGTKQALGQVDGTNAGAAAAPDPAAAAAAQKARADAAAARRAERNAEREARAQARNDARQAAAEAAAAEKVRSEAARRANAERVQQESQVTRAVRASTNQQTQAYRQLPAQITDITTSLASGMPLWLVAIQQGGQIRDSFGGTAAAGRALLTVLTPLRLIVGGVAGAFLALGLGALAGWRESDKLNKSLALTGNIAGTSLGQINGMARGIADAQDVAVGGVRDTLAALVAAGPATVGVLESQATAVTALRRLTGESAEEASKQFADQGRDITEWSVKANRAYNFLTAEQVRYIRQLQAQGRSAEATQYANEQLAATLNQRSVPAIGLLEQGWKRVGKELSSIIDSIKAIGRDTTVEEKIEELQARVLKIQQLRASAKALGNGTNDPKTDTERELEALQLQRNADLARSAERAIAQREEQARIERESKGFQDALASVSEAGAKRRLAQLEAQLDAEASAIERADAQGLLAADTKQQRLNAIEQRRLQAQAALLQRQIELERAKVEEKPIDGVNKAAAVSNLETQLLGVQAKIRAAQQQGLALVDQAALEDARKLADAWAEVWKRAYQQQRELAASNAEDQLPLITDPQQRADEAARLRSARVQRDVQDTVRDAQTQIELTQGRRAQLQQELDATVGQAGAEAVQRRARLEGEIATLEGMLTELRGQVRGLLVEGGLAAGEQGRQARVDSLQRSAQEVVERLANQESRIELEGGLDTERIEQRKFAARAKALPQLEKIRDALREVAQTPEELAALEQIELRIDSIKTASTDMETTLRGSIGSGFAQMFNDIATGAETAGDAFRRFLGGVAQSALNLITKRLGEQLAESLLPSGKGGGGGFNFLEAIGNLLIPSFHGGGIVGQSARMMQAVSPLAFAGAQVLHGGGMAGLPRYQGKRQVPAVLLEGEEVITENDPRHTFNGGGGSGGPIIGSLNVSVGVDGSNGGTNQAALADGLGRVIRTKVSEGIREEMRPGGLLNRG
jgi:phage-related minor tail protein